MIQLQDANHFHSLEKMWVNITAFKYEWLLLLLLSVFVFQFFCDNTKCVSIPLYWNDRNFFLSNFICVQLFFCIHRNREFVLFIYASRGVEARPRDGNALHSITHKTRIMLWFRFCLYWIVSSSIIFNHSQSHIHSQYENRVNIGHSIWINRNKKIL